MSSMRVTNTATYRNYVSTVNEVHSKYNKAMNKISTGKAYENAAENPLAYYSGKRMDNQYQSIESKLDLLTDIQNRLYQQELGARSIQSDLCSGSESVNTRIEYILNATNNDTSSTVTAVKDVVNQKLQSMVDALNSEYENFYIFGGNDLATTPFSLSYNESTNEMKLTYSHKFSGDDEATEFEFVLTEADDGSYSFKLTGDDADAQWENLKKAMMEQGRVDVGYGTISDTSTLLDTYTGGLNMLTGISSDSLKTGNYGLEDIENALADSAVGISAQAVVTMNKYIAYLDGTSDGSADATGGSSAIDKSTFESRLSGLLDEIDTASDKLSRTYSSLGSKYSLLDTTSERLEEKKTALEDQYQNILGTDFYESIVEMFSYQQSYTASLQVSSNIMRISLFDFMS